MSMSLEKDTERTWNPLPSDPEAFSKFAYELGMKKDFEFQLIYSFSKEDLEFLPQPVFAVISLLPYLKKPPLPPSDDLYPSDLKNIFFAKQSVHNACGTFALMHMLANLPESFLEKDSFSSSFFSTLQDKPPLARGFAIENTPNVEKMNVEICKEFAAPSSNEHDVKHHYSTFIEIDGKLFELDGRLPTPVLIGSCTREEFLMKTLSEIEKRIKEDTSGLPSSVIALTPKC